MKAYHIALIDSEVGLVGGLANALYSGNTFLLLKTDAGPPVDVLMPGLLATMFIGGIAAVVSWGLHCANAGAAIDGNALTNVAAHPGDSPKSGAVEWRWCGDQMPLGHNFI